MGACPPAAERCLLPGRSAQPQQVRRCHLRLCSLACCASPLLCIDNRTFLVAPSHGTKTHALLRAQSRWQCELLCGNSGQSDAADCMRSMSRLQAWLCSRTSALGRCPAAWPQGSGGAWRLPACSCAAAPQSEQGPAGPWAAPAQRTAQLLGSAAPLTRPSPASRAPALMLASELVEAQ